LELEQTRFQTSHSAKSKMFKSEIKMKDSLVIFEDNNIRLLNAEGSQTVTNYHQLKTLASGGNTRSQSVTECNQLNMLISDRSAGSQSETNCHQLKKIEAGDVCSKRLGFA